MRERVGRLVGPVAEKMWVSTFHSACVRILRRDAPGSGYPSTFTIYDQADAVRLTDYVVRDLGLDPKRFPPRAVHARSRPPRTRVARPSTRVEVAQVIHERKIAEVFDRSTRPVCSSARAPWTSTICSVHRASCFGASPRCSRATRAGSATCWSTSTRTPTRRSTWWSAGEGHGNVCVVGDDDQSIYGCAAPTCATSWSSRRDFPDATIVVLEQNYRSTQTILDAANAVIAHNLARKPKDLWTESGSGERIVRFQGEDEVDEARWITRGDDPAARRRRPPMGRHGGLLPDQRAEPRGRGAVPAGRRSVPVVGGTRFYDRREVKDALAYLKAVVNPTDEVSLKRVLNVPKRASATRRSAGCDAFATGRGDHVRRCAPRWDEAGVAAPSGTGHRDLPGLLDALAAEVGERARAAAAEAHRCRSGYLAELRRRARSRTSPCGEPGRASWSASRENRGGVPRAGGPRGRHRPAARPR